MAVSDRKTAKSPENVEKGRWKPEEREKWPLRAGFRRNKGEKPPRSKGKRVVVSLMSGELAGDTPVSSTSPTGWAVESTKFELTGWWFDVDQYRLL